jgi:hypothetical protein
VELEQLVLVALDGFEFGAQFVQEQGPDQTQDVGFAGVMRTQFPAPRHVVQVHLFLEQGAEDGRPVSAAAIRSCGSAC